MSELGKKGVAAVKWGAISSAGRFLLQLIAGSVLARILGPDIYGVFGMGLIVFMFSNFLADFGFGWGLVQRTELHDNDVRFAFTWQVMTGLVAGSALYFGATFISDHLFQGEPRVVPVIRWLSLACVLNAASAPAQNLLKRDLRFRALGLIQLISYAVGYIAIGIPLALSGQGVMALVAAWLSQSAVMLLGMYLQHPHSLRPLFVYAGASSMFNVGGTVFVTNLVNWFISNLDRVMIGRLLSTQAMGLYNAAANLSNMPSQLLLGSLQPTFLAAGARLQNDLPKLREAYLQIFSTIWALIAPAMTVAAVMAPDIVHLLYGTKWEGAAPVLSLLFLSVPLQLTWCMTTPVLWNNHRKHYEFIAQLPVLAASAYGFYAFAGRGVEAAALVAVGSTLLRSIVLIGVMMPGAHIRLGQIFGRFGRGAWLCALFGVAAWGGSQAVHWGLDHPGVAANWAWTHTALASHVIAPLAALAGGGGIAGLLGLALLLGRPQVFGSEAQQMLVRFVPRLSRLSKWLPVPLTPAVSTPRS